MGKAHLAAVVLILAGASAERAHACGGMFCSGSSPTPVDQSAERILFEVNDDGSVSATVEIKYQGNPQDFAWIVPVTGRPDFVEVAGKDELQLLDLATAPTYVQPSRFCGGGFSDNFGSCGGFGCNCEEALNRVDAPPTALDAAGVVVTDYPSVGPFDDIVVVEGGSADLLMQWLTDNDYQVNEKMRPFIETYIVEGYSFLATRLKADATVQDMVPIRFHCPQPTPEIPLRLTAISAEPEMGFLVFVVGAERYAPRNYADVVIDEDDVHLDFPTTTTTGSNYFALVSKRIDEAGGRGFVTEGVFDAAAVVPLVRSVQLPAPVDPPSRAHLEEVLRDGRTVTRFYGRMNAEEMTEDPYFTPSGNNVLKAPVLDLSAQRAECVTPGAPVCGTTYCGTGDACANSGRGEGCVCRDNHVARIVTGPTGGQQVACMAPDVDLHSGGAEVCTGTVCGRGTCVPINDRPTCSCDEGAVAVIADGALRCVSIVGEVFESEQVVSWGTPAPAEDEDKGTYVEEDAGCGASGEGDGRASVLLGLAAALMLRLRRRADQARC